jgi:hypothetical protein
MSCGLTLVFEPPRHRSEGAACWDRRRHDELTFKGCSLPIPTIATRSDLLLLLA